MKVTIVPAVLKSTLKYNEVQAHENNRIWSIKVRLHCEQSG